MRRVGMCEKNCRLSSLKLDCLSKKTLSCCLKSFRTESWPQGKAQKTGFEEKRIFSWLQEQALLSEVQGHQKHFFTRQPYSCLGIQFIWPITRQSGYKFTEFLVLSLFHQMQVNVRTHPEHSSAGNTLRHLSVKYFQNRQPCAADPGWFLQLDDLKASHLMLTWNNGWLEMHCGLKC